MGLRYVSWGVLRLVSLNRMEKAGKIFDHLGHVG
jgi:hypothetical protein